LLKRVIMASGSCGSPLHTFPIAARSVTGEIVVGPLGFEPRTKGFT